MMGVGEISAYKSFIVRDGSRSREKDISVLSLLRSREKNRLASLMESKFHLRFS